MHGTDTEGASLEEATGQTEFEWHAKDRDDIYCTYGRPRGVITPIIHAALGPQNALNAVMQSQFKALLAIRTWCGRPAIPPRGAGGFENAVKRFESPADVADEADARYQDYIGESLMTLYPDAFKEAQEAVDLGNS
jgi:hypothetical protein